MTEYTFTHETTNHEGIVIGSIDLTIHYRLVTVNGKDTADIYDVTEDVWTPSRGHHQRSVDDSLYDIGIQMADYCDDLLVERALREESYARRFEKDTPCAPV